MQHSREIRVCSGRSTERNVAAALGNRSSSTEKLLQLFDKRAKCQSRNDFHPELIAFYCIITSLIFAASTLCVVFIVLRRACYSPT